MFARSRRLTSIAALMAASTAACSAGAPTGTPPASSSTSSTAASTTGAHAETATSTGSGPTPPVVPIAFGSCADGRAPRTARCGLFTAPLDYADPSQGAIRMRLVKLAATGPGSRVGSLFINPGGPGLSGVDFVERLSSTFRALNRRFDLIGFDPRGVGDPDAVTCLDTAGLDRLVHADPVADDPGETDAMITVARALADACRVRSGRLVGHVGTADVVRDLDGMRAALGDAKLSYLGLSYGTEIGALYAARYPTRVRAMVLDGDVDPAVGPLDQATEQADAMERSYGEFLRRCRERAGCPLGADPGATVDRVLTALDARPAPAAGGRLVGRSEALVALLSAMYETGRAGGVQTAFARAERGDVAGIQSISDSSTGRIGGRYGHGLESNSAVNCADATAPVDVATYEARAVEVQARDPHFGDALVYGVLPCAFWPVHGPPPSALAVHGAPPILLVGATHDPATPYAWSQSLARQIDGSVLLTREGWDHTSYLYSSCIDVKVDAYLVDGVMPLVGSTCSS